MKPGDAGPCKPLAGCTTSAVRLWLPSSRVGVVKVQWVPLTVAVPSGTVTPPTVS